MDSSAKSRPRTPALSQAQLLPIQGSEENFQRCCATSSCATWQISAPQKAPPFGRAPLEAADTSELTHPEPRRIRDKDHLRFVSTQPCLICGRTPADAHHLRIAQSRTLGRKVSDECVVALCRGHHREVHRHGDEREWWAKFGIDPNVAARSLWLQSYLKAAKASKARSLPTTAAVQASSPMPRARCCILNRTTAQEAEMPKITAEERRHYLRGSAGTICGCRAIKQI